MLSRMSSMCHHVLTWHVRSSSVGKPIILTIALGDGDDTLGDDAMARLDDDNGLGPGVSMVVMEIANGVRFQTTKPLNGS